MSWPRQSAATTRTPTRITDRVWASLIAAASILNFWGLTSRSRFLPALGAARSGNPEDAGSDVAKSVELRDKLARGERRLLGRDRRYPAAGRRCVGAGRPREAARRVRGRPAARAALRGATLALDSGKQGIG